jgi:poly(3-hydroxybutyrate) depolymerase
MRYHLAGALAGFLILMSQETASSAVFEWEAKPAADHVMALRCYLPDGLEKVCAIVVLVPGMNGDGRSLVNDAQWVAFAQRMKCALIGCSIKGSQGAVYHEVTNWAGAQFLKGVKELAHTSNHSELETVSMGFWGHSAGGQWNYNFACWKPERTFAFIVNKGAYYQGVSTTALREIPSLWIAGAKDTEERIGNITSLYAENRRKGAPWGLLIEPTVNHAAGRSKEIGMAFLEDVLPLRIDAGGHLHPITGGSGWLGNFQSHEVYKNSTPDYGALTATWLPGKSTADIWRSISMGVPSNMRENQDLPQPPPAAQKP